MKRRKIRIKDAMILGFEINTVDALYYGKGPAVAEVKIKFLDGILFRKMKVETVILTGIEEKTFMDTFKSPRLKDIELEYDYLMEKYVVKTYE